VLKIVKPSLLSSLRPCFVNMADVEKGDSEKRWTLSAHSDLKTAWPLLNICQMTQNCENCSPVYKYLTEEGLTIFQTICVMCNTCHMTR
jgi:hypothetical protein